MSLPRSFLLPSSSGCSMRHREGDQVISTMPTYPINSLENHLPHLRPSRFCVMRCSRVTTCMVASNRANNVQWFNTNFLSLSTRTLEHYTVRATSLAKPPLIETRWYSLHLDDVWRWKDCRLAHNSSFAAFREQCHPFQHELLLNLSSPSTLHWQGKEKKRTSFNCFFRSGVVDARDLAQAKSQRLQLELVDVKTWLRIPPIYGFIR